MGGGLAGDGQLLPDVAGQVLVGGLPSGVPLAVKVEGPRGGVLEDDTLEVLDHLLNLFRAPAAQELGHVPQVHAGFLPDGDRQGLGGRVHRRDRLGPLDGALGEHIRLALQAALVVQNFQGAQEAVGAVLLKGLLVADAVDEPEFGGEAVVQAVQALLLPLDVGGVGVSHLEVDELAGAVPQLNKPLDAGGGCLAHLHRGHHGVFAEVERAVHQGIAEIADAGVCGNGGAGRLLLAGLRRQLQQLPVRHLEMLHGVGKLGGEVRAGDGLAGGVLLVAVHTLVKAHGAQHHLRVVGKVAVDRHPVRRLAQVHPVGVHLRGPVPFLEKEDVRRDLGARVALEGVVGEAHRAQQIGLLRQQLADGGVLLVQGAVGGDERHQPTGAHLVQALGEKVVVDEEVVLVVAPVRHLVLPEGDVGDGEVEEVIGKGRLFKAGHGDVGVLVELGGEAARDAVQLHAVELGAPQGLRHQPQEVAHAAGGLQDVAGLEAHALNGPVHGLDDGGGGVVGVEGGALCGPVLLVGQQLLELGVFLGPLRLVVPKGVGQTAPADVTGHDLLLLRGGGAPVPLDLLQEPDGGDVGPELGLGASFPQGVVGDVVVVALLPGLGRLGRFTAPRQVDDDAAQLDAPDGLLLRHGGRLLPWGRRHRAGGGGERVKGELSAILRPVVRQGPLRVGDKGDALLEHLIKGGLALRVLEAPADGVGVHVQVVLLDGAEAMDLLPVERPDGVGHVLPGVQVGAQRGPDLQAALVGLEAPGLPI